MNILIADDHAIVRKGLIQILKEELSFTDVTEAGNAFELFERVNDKDWDIIILDISMKGRNGLDILKQLRLSGISAPVLILSMHSEEQFGLRALKAGASGFLNKESATDELVNAIRRIISGRKYVSPDLAEILAGDHAIDLSNPISILSDRELQVFQLLARGKTITEISGEIQLSANTISTYRSRILDKLNLKNNSQLIRYALDIGI